MEGQRLVTQFQQNVQFCLLSFHFIRFHFATLTIPRNRIREMITFFCLITKIVSTLFRETRSEQNSVGNHNCTRAKDANKSYRKLMVQIFQISNVNFLRYTTSVAQSQDSLKKMVAKHILYSKCYRQIMRSISCGLKYQSSYQNNLVYLPRSYQHKRKFTNSFATVWRWRLETWSQF